MAAARSPSRHVVRTSTRDGRSGGEVARRRPPGSRRPATHGLPWRLSAAVDRPRRARVAPGRARPPAAGPSGMEEARAPLHRAPPPACGCVAARPLRGRARSASSVAAAWDARPSPRPLLARYLRQETGEGQNSPHPSQLGGQGARGGAGGAFISRRAACATRVYEAVRRGRMRWLGAHLELLSCRLTAAHHA